MEKKFKLKRASVLSFFACIILVTVSVVSSYAICQKIGDKAPDFELEELQNGDMVSLSDFKGKAVILTFWATWCPRCWEELDYIKARFEKEEKIAVLLVNMETQSLSPAHVQRIKEKANEHAIKFPMLLDKRLKLWDSYCVNSLPSTVIIDPEGNILFAEPNFYFASREQIEEVVKPYLNE